MVEDLALEAETTVTTHRTLFCDGLGQRVTLPRFPRRIVSLLSFATETLEAMGLASRIAGISSYCPRYATRVEAPVVGDYLGCDEAAIRGIEPDLVLVTSGAQRRLGERLAAQGLPVFVMPLPSTIHGVLENVLLLGGLVDDLPAARALVELWEATLLRVRSGAPPQRPRVVAELWFGRHPRMAGGLTFIHDLVEAAGGTNVFGAEAEAYMDLDIDRITAVAPDVWLLFSEPEYPVDADELRASRGWTRTLPTMKVIRSVVDKGRNVIHDGPSMMQTVEWLHGELAGSLRGSASPAQLIK